MSDQTCKTCRYWENEQDCSPFPAFSTGETSGECRRRAPVLLLSQCPSALRSYTETRGAEPNADADSEDRAKEEGRRVFPLTYAYDWCGEWHKNIGSRVSFEIRSRTIESLGLSVRSTKALKLHWEPFKDHHPKEIRTIGDFLNISMEDLNSVRGWGMTCLVELKEKLWKLGISLRDD